MQWMRGKKDLVPVCLLVLFSMLCAAFLPVLAVKLGAGGAYRPARDSVPEKILVELAPGESVSMTLEEITARGLAVFEQCPVGREESGETLPQEALCALAIVIRSRASYLILHETRTSADLFASDLPLFMAQPSLAVTAAASATEGQVLTYEGDVIYAASHAETGKDTVAAEALGYFDYPYLVSVPGVETPGEETIFYDSVTWGKLTLPLVANEEGNALYPVLEGCRRDSSGAVLSVRLSGKEISGIVFAEAMGLPSGYFDAAESADGYLFTVRGAGGGVGLSRRGAALLAERGKSCFDILSYYYPLCTVSRPV